MIGTITNIDDDRVQFHMEVRLLDKDRYVECKFINRSDVLPLDKGTVVTVYGELSKVSNDVVKFDNCYQLESR